MALTLQLHDIQLYKQGFVLFGRDKAGDSVCVHVTEGVETFFYVRNRDPTKSLSKKDLTDFKNHLNRKLCERLRWWQKNNSDPPCESQQCGCNNTVYINNQYGPDMVSPCKEDMARFMQSFNDNEDKQLRGITGVELVQGRSIIGYEGAATTFVKVSIKNYGLAKTFKSLFMRDEALMGEWEPFELALEPITRFMSNSNLVGFGFVQVENYSRVDKPDRISRCAHELSLGSTYQQDLVVLQAEPTGRSNYPLRMLSFDIECCSFRGKNCFPEAKLGDPVIQIGVVAETLFGTTTEEQQKIVFCLDETASISTGEIRSFATEEELLVAFFKFAILEFGADVVAGYNSNQFDMPYILERANQLKLRQYRSFSKMTARSIRHWKQKFESAQAGTRVTDQYNTPGLVMFDVFNYVKKTMNLRSYSLNNVAIAVLKDEKKDDMKYSDIPIFQKESPEKRAIVAKYCLQDTVLVSRLIHVRKMLVNNIEFSRICGILLQHSIEKGVSFKILRKVLQYTSVDHHFIPTFQRNADGEQIVPYYNQVVNDKAEYEGDGQEEKKVLKQGSMTGWLVAKKGGGKPQLSQSKKKKVKKVENTQEKRLKFQGAFVLDPQAGFHEDIVATLDFASLYPSEMRMHNMCPSTLLKSHAHAESLGLVRGRDYEEVASGFLFVCKSVKQGVLPRIETELHAERKAAKGELKAAKKAGDSMLISVYDGKQLAIKLVMNSIYGFTGSRTSAITALPIAISITAQGRHDIMETKRWVEKHFGKDFCKDAPGRANVVYGDTDSVMVKFEGLRDLGKAFKYAEEIERRINSPEVQDGVAGLFQMPMYLEFEKVFWPYFLLKKKKYLAMKYDAGELTKPPKVDAKGIEMIRNDWAKLCTNTQKQFVDILLKEKNKKNAVKYVRQRVIDLMEGKVDSEELVLSKKLSKFDYKAKQPHVEVARMLQKVDPMNAPALGDRVPFMIALNDKAKVAERAVPVSMKDQVDIDYEYYKEKQLKGPMVRLLEPLIGKKQTREVFKYDRSAKRRRDQEEVAINRLFKVKKT